jgi:glutathione S-transferase
MAVQYRFSYWPLPFRGNFVRNIFAYTNTSYSEIATFEEIAELRQQPVVDQACPFMGPPLLEDREYNLALSQMPAIVFYLGEQLELMPEEIASKAVSIKVLDDCTDLLAEITRSNGAQMWNQLEWDEFIATRFVRWLEIFEQTAIKNGVSESHYYFASSDVSVADLALHALFATMERCLPGLSPCLRQNAPLVMSVCDRISQNPGIKKLTQIQTAEYGDLYCGGDIEKSIRRVLAK